MDLISLIYLSVGLLLGGLIAYLFFKSRLLSKNSNESHIRYQEEKIKSLEHAITVADEKLLKDQSIIVELSAQKASLEADYRNLEEKLMDQKKEISLLHEKFSVEFKNLANEIFEEKSKKFTDQNKVNLGELLNPLGKKIQEFEKKIEDSNKESLKWNSALSTQVKSLYDLNQQITKEAENLTKALKGDSKTQGTWGEIQLEAILSKVGLEKDIHYFKEKNFKTEDGQNQRPDYIVKLPDNKNIVIDSKVSLTAYTNYFEADEEIVQKKFLKAHLASVHQHIKELGQRNYQIIHEIPQPDYVMMFIANEPALFLALKEDQTLFEKTLDRNIVLVSTTTLLATLRTIAYIWNQDKQNKNAIEIALQAGALYDKFEGFTNDLLKVGNSLKQTKDHYDAAMNKLVDGSGNLIKRTERLRELGAKATKQIDMRLVVKSQN